MEIALPSRHGSFFKMKFDRWHLALLTSVVCLFLITIATIGYLLGRQTIRSTMDAQILQSWQQSVERQGMEVEHVRGLANSQLEVLSERVAELQAELYQLDDLSAHLAEIADVDQDEWARMLQPREGYTTGDVTITPKPTDFMNTLDNLTEQLATHAQQLSLLEKLLFNRDLKDVIAEVSRVIDQGWVSSYFGYRIDPFTKRKAWHAGVDLSGSRGTPIKSVAPGVISFVGLRSGYGNLVEVDHGNGFITRYAHNHSNLVQMGDDIEKGQVIAEMGSSGRATGVHVHFEVLKDGKQINPLPYIKAAN